MRVPGRYGLLLMWMVGLASGCEYNFIEPPVNCDEVGLTIDILSVSSASCGQTDGEVSLTATGGDGVYIFRTEGFGDSETGNFVGLSAGNYNFQVLDGNQCTDQISVTVENSGGVIINTVGTVEAGCGEENGSVTINAVNGVQPYVYQLDGGPFQEGNTFSNLTPGEYEVRVRDALSCEFTTEVHVRSGVSFSQSISNIISTNCAISGCHAGSQFPDLRVFENIKNNAAQIKIRTGNKSMPQIGSLTQNEIDLIACWVDDGALNN